MSASRAALLVAAAALLLPAVGVHGYAKSQFSYNGLAQTPQMGWDNWNAFGCSVSESLLTTQAQLIVDLGLRDLGYEYVVLDDCWSAGRAVRNGTYDPTNNPNASAAVGELVVDLQKFPSGMAAVADMIHGLGLKFGMYSSAGKYTCGMYEGSLGNEEIDARTFASWGVDYLKYDNCFNEGQAGNQLLSYTRYKAMSDALKATGRPILYSLCNWGEDFPWNWASTIANSWRISGDVYDSFDRPDARCPCDGPDAFNCELPGFHCSILNIANKASFIVSKAQPGAWNDLDILTVGIGGMTDAEYVTEFSIWSAAKSPLLTGADFTKVSPKSLSIMANAAVIAVNQDPLGSSAARRWLRSFPNETDAYGRPGTTQLWAGSLQSTTGGDQDDYVVLLVNGRSHAALLEAPLADIFVDSGTGGTAPQVALAWEVRDLWGYRMTDAEAESIIARANSTVEGTGADGVVAAYNGTSYYYNATETPYAVGLANGTELLLGKVTTTVQPYGTVATVVEAHGAAMFRLRAVPTGSLRKRVEL